MSTPGRQRRFADAIDMPTPAFPALSWEGRAWLTVREKFVFFLTLLVILAATHVSPLLGIVVAVGGAVLFQSIRPTSHQLSERVFQQGGPIHGFAD